MKNKLLFVVGPTGSGKSDFAIKCAKLLNTEIISCDSMQIYRNMNIGTAKITKEEMQGITHHMIDVVDCNKEFSVAEYRDMALPIINNLLKNDKVPIICGGTGLYVDSILYPLNFSDTNKNAELRQQLISELNEKGSAYMHDKLKKLDSVSAEKIHENDTKRVIRALEINLTKGNRVENQLQKPIYDYLMIQFSPKNRELLYEKINNRVDKMFDCGLIEEVDNLLKNNLVTFSNQSMQAIGYKEFKAYINKEIDKETLKNLIKQHTRNYAKRQLTWFRKYNDIVTLECQNNDALKLVNDTFLR